MPRRLECAPQKLEDQCIYVYLNYLHDEMNLIFHLKNYREKSVLLKQHGLEPDFLISRLQCQLSNNLAGILQDIVRQKMVDILISTLHTVPARYVFLILALATSKQSWNLHYQHITLLNVDNGTMYYEWNNIQKKFLSHNKFWRNKTEIENRKTHIK